MNGSPRSERPLQVCSLLGISLDPQASGDPAEGWEAGEGFTSLSLVYRCLDREACLEYLMPSVRLQSPSKHFSPPESPGGLCEQ